MPKIIHITTVHRRNDIRIFQKELKTLAHVFGDITFIVNDNLGQSHVGNIEILDLGIKTSNRFSRFFKPFFALLPLLKRMHPDIVHFHDPELMIMGIVMACRGCSVIYDSHEDLPKDILHKVWIPKIFRGLVSFLANVVEHISLRFFKAIIFVIESQVPRLGYKKHIVLHNYPITSDYPEKVVAPAEKYFIHIGTLSEERGLREMMDALALLPEGYTLHIVGAIPPEALKTAQTHIAWNRVIYTEWVNKKDLIPMTQKAIAGLLLFYPFPNMYNSSPNKLFEYMASGIPVIASDFPVFREILGKNECGSLVNPQDHRSVYNAMMEFIRDDNKRTRMGTNGLRAVRDFYNWEKESRKLIALYHDILIEKK